MKIPNGVNDPASSETYVCKLKRYLYGLRQASRCWNQTFNIHLIKLRLKQSEADNSVYYGLYNNVKIIVIYVDDGLIISDSQIGIQYVLSELEKTFKMTISETGFFAGFEILLNRTENLIFNHQTSYIRQIVKRFGFKNSNPISIPTDPHTNLTMK